MKTLFLALTVLTMSASAFSMGMDLVGDKDGADCGERSVKEVQLQVQADAAVDSTTATVE